MPITYSTTASGSYNYLLPRTKIINNDNVTLSSDTRHSSEHPEFDIRMIMFSRPLAIILALPFLASVVQAFGPSTPVIARPSNTRKSINSNGGGGITMRLGKSDLKRRGSVRDMLRTVVVAGNPVATKTAIETTLLTEGTEIILKKMNWRRRDAMIRKVRSLAMAYDVAVGVAFGIPPTRLEREATDAQEASVRRDAKKIHFDRVKSERDAAVAARAAAGN
jgi:hypothetical protein